MGSVGRRRGIQARPSFSLAEVLTSLAAEQGRDAEKGREIETFERRPDVDTVAYDSFRLHSVRVRQKARCRLFPSLAPPG